MASALARLVGLVDRSQALVARRSQMPGPQAASDGLLFRSRACETATKDWSKIKSSLLSLWSHDFNQFSGGRCGQIQVLGFEVRLRSTTREAEVGFFLISLAALEHLPDQ